MIAFSVGTIVGDIFLHMFPEFDELAVGNKDYTFIMIGLVSFYICDYLIELLSNTKTSHSHSHSHKTNSKPKIETKTEDQKSSAFIYLLGDFLHNFTDGIAIGASYSVSLNNTNPNFTI